MMEPTFTFDGREYTQEQMDTLMAKVHRLMYSEVGEWLKEFKLVALERIERIPYEDDLGEGWRLVGGRGVHTMHGYLGLKVPFLWTRLPEEEALDVMARMVRRLGERLWASRPDLDPAK
jgi:hypothetical protein